MRNLLQKQVHGALVYNFTGPSILCVYFTLGTSTLASLGVG